MISITSYGAYIPKLRLERMAIVQALGWYAPAIMMVADGERAMCNWDEDSVTMAVAAARDCLTGMDNEAALLQGVDGPLYGFQRRTRVPRKFRAGDRLAAFIVSCADQPGRQENELLARPGTQP